MMSNLSWVDRIRFRIFRKVYLEHRQFKGWSRAEPFYLLNCPIHGPYEDYPHGREEVFVCPKFLELRLIANER